MLCWYIIKGKSALIVCPPQFYRNYKTLKSSKWYLQKCSSWFRPINSAHSSWKIIFMVVTLTGCSIITITDFTLYFFDQDYKVVRMSFFDRCSQILHNFFLCAENELINNFPSFCFLQVDEKTICPHQCKWNTYYYQGRHLPSNIGGPWDIF